MFKLISSDSPTKANRKTSFSGSSFIFSLSQFKNKILVQYSDELLAMQEKGGSNLEALDEVEMKVTKFVRGKNLMESSKLAEEMDKKLVISPPESPKSKK